MLLQLLKIFDEAGGYKAAAEQRKNTKRGCRGLAVGGKATLLDAMCILIAVWNNNGKYATVDGIRHCWRKANILSTAMQTIINKEIGSNSIPNKEKASSIEDCNILCECLEKLQVQTANTGVDTNTTAIAFQGSIASEVRYSNDDLIKIATNWVNIEDEPEIINVTVDEEIEESENTIGTENELNRNDDNEINDDPEPEIQIATSIDDSDKLTHAQIENMISQLKCNCNHIKHT